MNFRAHTLGLVLGALPLVSHAAIEISEPYARATPPNAPNSAAFMTIINSGDHPVSLIKASTPVAENVELHTHTQQDGMMKMRQVAEIDVAQGGETVLQPGGLHIMLFDLTSPLIVGESFPLTLTFSDGTTVTKSVPIRKIMPSSMMKQSHKTGQ